MPGPIVHRANLIHEATLTRKRELGIQPAGIQTRAAKRRKALAAVRHSVAAGVGGQVGAAQMFAMQIEQAASIA